MPSKIFSLGMPFDIQYCIETAILKFLKYPVSDFDENKGELGPVKGKYQWYAW